MLASAESAAKFLTRLFILFIIFTAATAAGSLNVRAQIKPRTPQTANVKSNKKMSEPLTGEWSGKHITIKFNAEGADIEYDCAHGAIARKIILDRKNSFSVAGTYAEERGGPVRADAKPENVAVKYAGQIIGKKMTLTVWRADDKTLVGKFTLLRGQEFLLVKCR